MSYEPQILTDPSSWASSSDELEHNAKLDSDEESEVRLAYDDEFYDASPYMKPLRPYYIPGPGEPKIELPAPPDSEKWRPFWEDLSKVDLSRDLHEHYAGFDVYVRPYDEPGWPEELKWHSMSKRFIVKVMSNGQPAPTPYPIGIFDDCGPILPVSGHHIFILQSGRSYIVKYMPNGHTICTFGGRPVVEYLPFVSGGGEIRHRSSGM
ncbi:hypothetical protein VNI00_014953 [Paramarasmius palmivorus]|uniref:Uncharacterized protein n=1 Tax=Paramarasmius palmivorus TaxID=297713 RepID=A0AAW0BNF2_9AGAR